MRMEDWLYEWVEESEGTTIDTLDFTLQVAKFLQCQPAYLNHAALFKLMTPCRIVDGNTYYGWLMAERWALSRQLEIQALIPDYGTTLFSDSSYTMDLPSTKHMH